MGKLLDKLLLQHKELLSKLKSINAEIEQYQTNPELEDEKIYNNRQKKIDLAVDDFCELVNDYDLAPILKKYLVSHKHTTVTAPNEYRPHVYEKIYFRFKDLQVHIDITFNGEDDVDYDIAVNVSLLESIQFPYNEYGYVREVIVDTLKESLDLPENVLEDYATILTKLYNTDLGDLERFI